MLSLLLLLLILGAFAGWVYALWCLGNGRPVPFWPWSRGRTPVEPAPVSPIPVGLTLDEYVAGGIADLRLMLVQHARRQQS